MAEGAKSAPPGAGEIQDLRRQVRELEAEVQKLRGSVALDSMSLLDGIEDGFVAFDPQWNFTFVSRNAEFQLHRAGGELLGRRLWEEYPDLLGTPTEQALRRAMEERVRGDSEIYFAPLAGWFQGRYLPAPDGGILVFFRNITESKMAEAALRRSETRWHALANAMPQFVWTAQSFGDVQFVNDYWYEYTGTPKGDLTWNTLFQALHPEDLETISEMWRQAVETSSERRFEYRVRRASDGMWRWHLGFHRPERDASGAVVRWIGTGFEVHDLKSGAPGVTEP